ncbi:MAG: LytTR family transcriptional regulator DNA-binding domain-containing protein [Pyrinomonadaceae bacterium]
MEQSREAKFDSQILQQIHRSIIVNIDQIKET